MALKQLVSLFIVIYCVSGATAVVTITIGGSLVSDGGVVNVTEGEDLVFVCSTSDGAADVSLSFSPSALQFQATALDSTRTFNISNVERNNDNTVVTCTDNAQTSSFTMEVFYSPSIDFSPSVYTEFEFNSLTVNATVDANPVPSTAMWTRNGQAVSGSGISTTVTSISFTNLSREDNGTYSILANNGIGDGSGTFDLIVYFGPEFIGRKNGSTINQPLTVGQRLIINCTVADSNPTEYIVTITLPNDSTINSSIYIIESVDRSDRGVYTCTASTSVSFAILIYSVSVNEVSPTVTSTMSTTTMTTMSTTIMAPTMTPSTTPSGGLYLTSSTIMVVIIAVFLCLFIY